MVQILKKKRRGRPSGGPSATTSQPHRSNSSPPPLDRRSSGRKRRNVRYNFDIDDYVDDDEFFNDGNKKKIKLLLGENDVSKRRVYHAPEDEDEDSDDDVSEDERKLKKRKLVVQDNDEDEDEENDNNIVEARGRRLGDYDDEEEDNDNEAGGSDYDRGMESDHRKGTRVVVPMPDKRTLEFVLDKLQKKDTYGVYARPVDPDELPDYYDVIKHPMDFATVRRKLAKGSYSTLKEFESDVLLICSNAMQYNAPDTVYYKQASSIQEQAKLRFQRLRANVDRPEIEVKSEHKTLPSFSLPKKQFKKSVSLNEQDPDSEPVGSATLSGAVFKNKQLKKSVSVNEQDPDSDPVGSETLSGAAFRKKQLKKTVSLNERLPPPEPVGSETLSGAGFRTEEYPNGSPAQTPVRLDSGEVGEVLITESSSLVDVNVNKDQELLPVATPKVDLEGVQGKGSVSKLARKPSVPDENRRATYSESTQPVTDSGSVLSTFEGESKQFIPVGLHADHSYARSVARFAATLGSVAWKVASHTIEQVLPEGVKYGRGWVGEYEPLSNPVLIPENRTLKVPDFLAHFKNTSDVIDNEKASKFIAPNNHKAPNLHTDRKELNGGFNPGIPVKEQSPRRPPFLSSLQENHAFSGSSLSHQNLPQVELNHPPVTHVNRPPLTHVNHPPVSHGIGGDFVTRKPISKGSDIPSPRPSKPVGNLTSFKHPNSNKVNPTPVGLDSNRMVPMVNKLPYRHEVNPIAVNRDCNKNVHIDNNMTRQQEQQQGLSDPVQMMKMLAEKTQHQQNNTNGFGFGSKRDDLNNAALQHQQDNTNGFGFGSKRDDLNNAALLHQQTNINGFSFGSKRDDLSNAASQHQQNSTTGFGFGSKRDDLNNAALQHQQNNTNGFSFGAKRDDLNNAASQLASKRDDSSNVALTAAQAWMSLGGAGGFTRPPLTENINPHKQMYPDYNRQQPQVSRFRGEFPGSGIHYQQPVHGFVQQPVRAIHEAQAQAQAHLQNRNNVGFPQLATDLSRFQVQSNWRGVTPQMQQQPRPKQQESHPPDLNIGYQSMGSPVKQSTGMMVDSQHPDLALQL